MPLPALTASSSLRDPDARAGRAQAGPRGLVPAAPFCVQAQFFNGNEPVGAPASAEARKAKYAQAARDEAEQRVRQLNPGLAAQPGLSVRIKMYDRATNPIAYNACQNAAAAANILALF